MTIPEVETERLLMRSLESSDLDAYSAMYADPDVMRFLEDGRPATSAEAWRSMAIHLGHWKLRGFGQWALIERATDTFVGRAGLWQPEGWPGLEVGWVLARTHWGRGFATEAAKTSIAYAFETLGASEIISLIVPGNVASVRVAERVGEYLDRPVEVQGRVAHLYRLTRR